MKPITERAPQRAAPLRGGAVKEASKSSSTQALAHEQNEARILDLTKFLGSWANTEPNLATAQSFARNILREARKGETSIELPYGGTPPALPPDLGITLIAVGPPPEEEAPEAPSDEMEAVPPPPDEPRTLEQDFSQRVLVGGTARIPDFVAPSVQAAPQTVAQFTPQPVAQPVAQPLAQPASRRAASPGGNRARPNAPTTRAPAKPGTAPVTHPMSMGGDQKITLGKGVDRTTYLATSPYIRPDADGSIELGFTKKNAQGSFEKESPVVISIPSSDAQRFHVAVANWLRLPPSTAPMGILGALSARASHSSATFTMANLIALMDKSGIKYEGG
ncbi:MAG: hypothetical protein Q8R63_02475 [Ramlibacter sp.]|nr:hypothetical protein [Ramlibacter sp.]